MNLKNKVKSAFKGLRLGWKEQLEYQPSEDTTLSGDFVEHIQQINRRIDAIERNKKPIKTDDDYVSQEEKLERAIENVSNTSLPSDYFINQKYPGLEEIEKQNLIQRYSVEDSQIVIRFKSGEELIISARQPEIISQLTITADNLDTPAKRTPVPVPPSKETVNTDDLS